MMTPTLSKFDQFEWETNGLGVHKKHWGFRCQGSQKPWTWPKFTPCGGSKLVSIKNSVLPTTWTKHDWCIDRWNYCVIVCKKSLRIIHENHWWFICVFIDNVNKTKTWKTKTRQYSGFLATCLDCQRGFFIEICHWIRFTIVRSWWGHTVMRMPY